ncbi:MAG TPA: hypothetical protein VIY26_03480 [Acidimicrobiales bacterium]
MGIVEMLDQLAGEDGVELPSEVEVLRVCGLHVETLLLELADRWFVEVDSHQFGHTLGQEAVDPVGFAVARRAPDVEHGGTDDQRADNLEPIAQRSAAPGLVPPFRLEEMAGRGSVRWDQGLDPLGSALDSRQRVRDHTPTAIGPAHRVQGTWPNSGSNTRTVERAPRPLRSARLPGRATARHPFPVPGRPRWSCGYDLPVAVAAL